MSNNTFENLMDYFLDVLLVERRRKLVCSSKDKVQAFFFFFSGHFLCFLFWNELSGLLDKRISR